MSFPKVLILSAVVLFGAIGTLAVVKKNKSKQEGEQSSLGELAQEISQSLTTEKARPERLADSELPYANRIDRLFTLSSQMQLPIVETVTYRSQADWIKGRPAWIADYASHYDTSTHFISRSLSRQKKYDYFKVANGNKFNVLRSDKEVEFYLLVDLERAKCWFYYLDKGADERVLLKVYDVGLGRPNEQAFSGFLTPIGKYSLGGRIASYKPGVQGFFNNERVEMIRTFGTRWIPFEEELGQCSEPAQGFGIHGVPWIESTNGQLVEDISSLGKYDSDGCIRFSTEDIEEIYAITVTKPTVIEIVPAFEEAELPGSKEAEL